MVLNFAHRGSLTEAPENTLPAFQKALDHGTKAIELDVQLTKDDRLVICHNHTFSKYNREINGRIRDFTIDQVKQVDVGSVFSEEFKGVALPTLEEVLEICPLDVKLNVEIKNIPVIYPRIEEILLDCLRKYDRLDNLVISSFDHVALEKVQQLAPDVELGMLFYYRILRAWEYAKDSGLNITSIHPNNVYTDRKFVEKCKENGFNVYPYTVNSVKRYEELVDFGVDGVFSNNPAVFGG
ncbi:glycerophosphodiester phosphodiesterase [Virgibacillus necropolis]|uniref:Glycerophosphodiester phosphodiesterase n=1 Tax=Virgibacillus necropolis TaxID=163877 RepID=A0A221M8Y3_9BACI|nr:glycerophosphodiester phosphodiesterase family protein [Virgibacillus necropolis]ASN04126.1 glycerophosphodiester phosphodiesterase [Virgibacillus necropolis]